MAQKVTHADLSTMKSLYYQDFMPEILPGSLLFCSGNYFVSNMIRNTTHSLWSHITLLFNIEEIERTLVLESVYGTGVRLVTLAKYAEDYEQNSPYDGSLVVAQVEGVTEQIDKNIAQFGLSILTSPYDTDELVKGLFRVLKGSGTPQRDREYTCAELVYESFLAGGIEFPYDKRGFISPEDIWMDPRVQVTGRIETHALLNNAK